MPEKELLDVSTPVIRRAVELLDACFDVLVDPDRWCKRAYAQDAAGEPIGGDIVEAVESSEVVSRCVFGELVHQGLARGYRIEIETRPVNGEQAAAEVTRAPASWMIAAVALALATLDSVRERIAFVGLDAAREQPPREMRLSEFVLASVFFSDRSSYSEAIGSVALAAELVRAELDLRVEGSSER